ncbi:Hypp8628 [Branchiostoma lanceolatum]|uniref:Hypp8628 protein n=1 Tax=Branchiostoma lanceolatum TaxID=7740 RepID=A0A8K0EFB3_BRALA|nr:Hypp8628 [Branchiostoma lanceolatum]
MADDYKNLNFPERDVAVEVLSDKLRRTAMFINERDAQRYKQIMQQLDISVKEQDERRRAAREKTNVRLREILASKFALTEFDAGTEDGSRDDTKYDPLHHGTYAYHRNLREAYAKQYVALEPRNVRMRRQRTILQKCRSYSDPLFDRTETTSAIFRRYRPTKRPLSDTSAFGYADDTDTMSTRKGIQQVEVKESRRASLSKVTRLPTLSLHMTKPKLVSVDSTENLDQTTVEEVPIRKQGEQESHADRTLRGNQKSRT